MAEESFAEKTEEPTDKKLTDAREKGNVAKSQELMSAMLLLTFTVLLFMMGESLAEAPVDLLEMIEIWMQGPSFDQDRILSIMRTCLDVVAGVLLPFILALFMMKLLVGFAQTGGVFSFHPLKMDFQRLSMVKNFKSKFMSPQPIADLVKQLLKVSTLAVSVYVVMGGRMPQLLSLMRRPVSVGVEQIVRIATILLFTMAITMLFIAILDLLFEFWNHRRKLRMTKQEVKEEGKSSEGDPQVKSRIRSLQRAASKKRMMQDVEKADVIVVNPTHRAIALKYDPLQHAAPIVLAKGERKVAQAIREIGQRKGIPIYEDRPLAKALIETGRIGQAIPPDLFFAVAEVLAYVYRQKHGGYGPRS